MESRCSEQKNTCEVTEHIRWRNIMSALLQNIQKYWTKRADSYAFGQFTDDSEKRWMKVVLREFPKGERIKVLDIGTGPGFFAINLAKRGFEVTAVDYTPAMLEEAKKNAGAYRDSIRFLQMDAQKLTFADETFDVVISRNLTWNLENPQKAYKEWRRVLKKGGVMLNFDAGWYEYLYDEEKAKQFQQDRENVERAGCFDYNGYEDADKMEEISRSLILSKVKRPQADLQMMLEAGFTKFYVDTEIWQETLDEEEKVNYASTPGFMLKGIR